MVSGFTLNVGDKVRDKKLGLVWTTVDWDEEWVYILRNGVTAHASFWDLESPTLDSRTKQALSQSGPP